MPHTQKAVPPCRKTVPAPAAGDAMTLPAELQKQLLSFEGKQLGIIISHFNLRYNILIYNYSLQSGADLQSRSPRSRGEEEAQPLAGARNRCRAYYVMV